MIWEHLEETLNDKNILFRCFNGGSCMDGVDSYFCSCPEGYFGINCECGPEAVGDPSLCLNVNESVSWELPSKDLLMSLTTTMSPEDELTTLPIPLELGIDPPDIQGSIDPSKVVDLTPTSLIVYNFSDPVTSLFIYEVSSSDLVTMSFLAGDDYVIKTSPTIPADEMGKS